MVYEMDNYDNEDDYDSLSRGEKAAYSRGNTILTMPQLAFLYLIAKSKYDNGDYSYIGSIDIVGKMGDFDKDGRFIVKNIDLADILNIPPTTIGRTINKFLNLIIYDGDITQIDTERETLYDKLIKAYNTFKDMSISELLGLAEEAIPDEVNTVYRDRYDRNSENVKKRKLDKKSYEFNIAQSLAGAIRTLYYKLGQRAEEKPVIVDKMLKRESLRLGIPLAELRRIYNKYCKETKACI